MKCSICGAGIDEGTNGHNAEPVNNGRCCDACNFTVVLPRRMREMLEACQDWRKEVDKGEKKDNALRISPGFVKHLYKEWTDNNLWPLEDNGDAAPVSAE